MPKKETRDPLSTLASEVLSGRKKPTLEESRRLAGGILSQDETKGPRKAKKKLAKKKGPAR